MAIVKTDNQHYADIATAIRSKTGGTVQYKPQQMSDAILGLETGSGDSAIIVYAPAGSSVTLTCGGTVRTVPEDNGVWRFPNCPLGTYVIECALNGMSASRTLVIQEEGQLMRYEILMEYTKIFGVMRDITSTSPAWTRTDASVNFTAKASVGTVAGSSDFDACYPWSGIRRENFSSGDVMVRIPRFWYQRFREGNMEYLKIADSPAAGFKLHPAFCHDGIPRDAVYVGAYITSEGDRSISGVLPKNRTTRASFRASAKAKGDGWGLIDLSTLSALQMLFLVEYATFNCQEAVGAGYSGYGQYEVSAINTGSTDAVPNLTGVPAGTPGQVEAVWRGMEGLWSNTIEYLDGLILDSGTMKYYVCNNPASYAETHTSSYATLSFGIPTFSGTYGFVTKLGLDPNNDHIMLAAEAGSGSGSTHVCDSVSRSSESVLTVAKYGGRWYSKEKAGLFKIEGSSQANSTASHSGSRMMFIPQEVVE